MTRRLLPIKCEAIYYPEFLGAEEAKALFSEITRDYDVSNKVVLLEDGTEFLAETGSYMFADEELTSFDAFAEVWGPRSPWPDSLLSVRQRVEQATGHRYQVGKCVYYEDGTAGMGFHRDLVAYGPTDAIASLSLGAERQFVFRSVAKPDETYRLRLTDGSLLFMGAQCQDRYEHGVLRDPECSAPRLNLTFRKYGLR